MLHDVSPVYIELGNGLAPLWQVLDWLTDPIDDVLTANLSQYAVKLQQTEQKAEEEKPPRLSPPLDSSGNRPQPYGLNEHVVNVAMLPEKAINSLAAACRHSDEGSRSIGKAYT